MRANLIQFFTGRCRSVLYVLRCTLVGFLHWLFLSGSAMSQVPDLVGLIFQSFASIRCMAPPPDLRPHRPYVKSVQPARPARTNACCPHPVMSLSLANQAPPCSCAGSTQPEGTNLQLRQLRASQTAFLSSCESPQIMMEQ